MQAVHRTAEEWQYIADAYMTLMIEYRGGRVDILPRSACFSSRDDTPADPDMPGLEDSDCEREDI